MAITCEWNVVVGTLKYKETPLTLYGGGNVWACFCYEEVEKDGSISRTLADFIMDKEHLKRVLADPCNGYGDYTDIRLNGDLTEAWHIAKLLVKHGHTVTMYNGGKNNGKV